MNQRRFLFFLSTALLGATIHLSALEIHNVNIPETRRVGNQELKLNGVGVRHATILKVKVYVASFYSPTPLRTAEEVYASAGPLRIELCYLRAFSQEKTQEAWKWQLEQSAEYKYDGYDRDAAATVSAFGSLRKYQVETIEIEGDETRFYDDGVLKATIQGKNYQKAFLSIWFGSKPVMPELKAALLGEKKK